MTTPPLIPTRLATIVDSGEATLRAGAKLNTPTGQPREESWPTLAPEALYGLAGRIVNAIDPYNEGDKVGTLVQLLTAAGNLMGPWLHATVQYDRHPPRLFVALVGQSSKARKGLSWSTPRHILRQVDLEWGQGRITSGLSSAEGLIYSVRDPDEPAQRKPEEGEHGDPGEDDKRLLVIEPELAVILKRMRGETNTLSAILREAWDSGDLRTLTKNSPLKATNAHISIIAHTTEEELRQYLTETERANGFANRFMFFAVKRSKILPDGEPPPEELLRPFIKELMKVSAFAFQDAPLPRDSDASALWAHVYPALSAPKPGLLGAIVARGEAHVLRLSVLYAILDQSPVIKPVHLKAALAVWDYSEASARRIFGDRLGLEDADAILAALRVQRRMSRTDISRLFHRNIPAARIENALAALQAAEKARRGAPGRDKPGRPTEIWEVVE